MITKKSVHIFGDSKKTNKVKYTAVSVNTRRYSTSYSHHSIKYLMPEGVSKL